MSNPPSDREQFLARCRAGAVICDITGTHAQGVLPWVLRRTSTRGLPVAHNTAAEASAWPRCAVTSTRSAGWPHENWKSPPHSSGCHLYGSARSIQTLSLACPHRRFATWHDVCLATRRSGGSVRGRR